MKQAVGMIGISLMGQGIAENVVKQAFPLMTVRGRSGRHAKRPFRWPIAASQGDMIRRGLVTIDINTF